MYCTQPQTCCSCFRLNGQLTMWRRCWITTADEQNNPEPILTFQLVSKTERLRDMREGGREGGRERERQDMSALCELKPCSLPSVCRLASWRGKTTSAPGMLSVQEISFILINAVPKPLHNPQWRNILLSLSLFSPSFFLLFAFTLSLSLSLSLSLCVSVCLSPSTFLSLSLTSKYSYL